MQQPSGTLCAVECSYNPSQHGMSPMQLGLLYEISAAPEVGDVLELE